MSASISDILTATKNIVTALNGYTNALNNINGVSSVSSISTPTLVKSSSGRAVSVNVTTAGSSVGTVYDSASVSALTNPIYIAPSTVGVYAVNMPTQNGIVVVPGTGQVLAISYS